MVKHVSKVIIGSVCAFVIASAFSIISVSATDSNTNFEVNVKESLIVSIDTPVNWASGNIDDFVRNKITVNVSTNNPGYTVTMSTKTSDTNLSNASKRTIKIPTLESNTTRQNFPANHWGFSLDDTNEGSSSSSYSPLIGYGNASTIAQSASGTTLSKDIYFGARANAMQASGTYDGTVIINVVTGVIDSNNPAIPTNPATPSNSYEVATYQPAPAGNTSTGATTYTYRRTSGGRTITTTEVSEGDNVSSYNGYTPPQGVTTSTTSSINDESSLAVGLTITASIAAASGLFFFILAKRRDEDEEEEENQQQ